MRTRSLSHAVLAGSVLGCGADRQPGESAATIVVIPTSADEATSTTAEILRGYLERIAGSSEVVEVASIDPDAVTDVLADHAAALAIVLEGERDGSRFSDQRLAALGVDGFAIEHDVQDERVVLWTAANSALSRQFAGYEVLRRLGARFYHPEQEHLLELDAVALRRLARAPTILQPGGRDAIPDVRWRSWSFHSAHPLEHLESFSDGDHPIDEAAAVNAWIVKNRGNRFRGPGRGVATEAAGRQRETELEALRVDLGFPTGAGITLHNQQQGASADIDPSSDVPVQQQIAELVARRLAERPDAAWFGIHFGPTEFTTTPDTETVQWITWAAEAARAANPDIAIEINNHITGAQPSPNFDDLGCANRTNADGRIDYYDLAFHTDASFGIQVHTVMFYPLEGEARVYAQQSFEHKLCLMQRASSEGRPVTYFPEGSWWLSFDNAVPVYLPLYIATRHRDTELLRPLLPRNGGTLAGVRMFNSGHEWGYWQQDYAVGLMAVNAELSLDDVLGELLDPLCGAELNPCSAKAEALAILREVIDHQRETFLVRSDARGRPGGLFTYFAGEDDADVIAAASGLEFRPVRPGFAEVSAYGEGDRAAFEAIDLAALDAAALAYGGWTAAMRDVAAGVPIAANPWIAEIVDGLEIVGLRARHTAALYRAALAYADAPPDDQAEAAAAAWAEASAALAAAAVVVARREAAYRYPAEQVYGGGLTPETAVPNGTTYPYRVHTKTHLLSYWNNRHDEVAVILAGGIAGDPTTVALRDAVAARGEPITASWPSLEPLGGQVDVVGIGTLVPPETMLVTGDAAGAFAVQGLVVAGDREIPVAGTIARSDSLGHTPREGLTLLQPEAPTAAAVLGSVFPALDWAVVGTSTLVVAHDADDDGIVSHDHTFATPMVDLGGAFEAEPITLEIPVALASGGATVAVTLRDAVMRGALVDGGLGDEVEATGAIEIEDLVAALVELAGFDEQGSLETLADLLGFDADAPPETIPFQALFVVETG